MGDFQSPDTSAWESLSNPHAGPCPKGRVYGETSAGAWQADLRRRDRRISLRAPGRRAQKGLFSRKNRRYNARLTWADSSAGRAPRSQCGGREFDPHSVHHRFQKMPAGPPVGIFNLQHPVEGFPSGQRDQTVNLTALPSKVRILPPPPPRYPKGPGASPGLFAFWVREPPCPKIVNDV